jgi:ABC-type lipoprotein release transport system permease subunit
VLATAIATMLLAVLAATFVPAIAAMRVNPAEALRQD